MEDVVKGTQRLRHVRDNYWEPPEGWRVVQMSAGYFESSHYPRVTYVGCWVLLEKE